MLTGKYFVMSDLLITIRQRCYLQKNSQNNRDFQQFRSIASQQKCKNYEFAQPDREVNKNFSSVYLFFISYIVKVLKSELFFL